ncbi:circadian clock protein KaiC [Salinarchaeum sp. Harcht-Bsk1]|uniref:KaiC domain-containing protein n=1 Tax=Salinarchaeum sp. Harcht-Bsk1 TaxID=1333523 RepID=UPI0003422DFC|nr:KaiC domain-containing protein [Salinarchaeum sp. Harcht-Bsk1]AGN01974.1 circadian clock protein KaiC [Salinarchaeum sp. Harcht-Bsk1]
MSDEDWFESAVGSDDDGDADDNGDARDGDADAERVDESDGAASGDEATGVTENGADEEEPDALETPGFAPSSDEDDLDDRIPDLGDDLGDSLGEEPLSAEDIDPDLADEEDGGGLFEDDFTAALQEAEDEGFGMGGNAEPTDPAFSMGTDAGGGFGDVGVTDLDDDPDSDIPRIDLGIEGLDEMIQGGVPERSLMVAIGSAGTGKTTFGHQFLYGGLQNGERAVFIALEESRERVIRSASEKGFQFDEYVDDGQLAVVDIDPVEMANSLQTIRSELPRLIDEFGADRLVLDSVSLLEMMYEERATRRNEIYDFTRSLKEAGITTMLTSEASEETPYASRHGIVEYLTDAVFVLQYVRPSDFRETRMAVEIQKIRDANHSREMKPYEITNEGIEVFRQANLF